MTRVLKNMTRDYVKNIFRGREVQFAPKASKSFNMEHEEERAEYYFWKERYAFMRDITANLKGVVE